MSTRAIATDGELAVAADTYISSALTIPVQLVLPVVNDGSGATVAVDVEMRFETTAGGSIEILDSDGHRVGIVPGRSQAVIVARSGVVQGGDQAWNFEMLPQTPAATIADAVVAHALNATFDDTEAEAALDALGVIINKIIAVLGNMGATKVE